jgi:ferredoxin-NADP reductase
MAISKHARVTRSESFGRDSYLLELAADEPLGFVGGQYVIVDSGLVLPSGKAVKRAYSLLSADADQQRFELAAKRIPGGLGSGFLHGLVAEASVKFSGPWGKLFPQPGTTGATLVLATDTGITAALGLVQGRRFQPLLAEAQVVWLRTAPAYFLPDALVRSRIPARCAELQIEPIPEIGLPERLAHARCLLARLLERFRFAQAFLCGDGSVNYALLDDLVAAGVPCTKDQLESFFNMPKKSP